MATTDKVYAGKPKVDCSDMNMSPIFPTSSEEQTEANSACTVKAHTDFSLAAGEDGFINSHSAPVLHEVNQNHNNMCDIIDHGYKVKEHQDVSSLQNNLKTQGITDTLSMQGSSIETCHVSAPVCSPRESSDRSSSPPQTVAAIIQPLPPLSMLPPNIPTFQTLNTSESHLGESQYSIRYSFPESLVITTSQSPLPAISTFTSGHELDKCRETHSSKSALAVPQSVSEPSQNLKHQTFLSEIAMLSTDEAHKTMFSQFPASSSAEVRSQAAGSIVSQVTCTPIMTSQAAPTYNSYQDTVCSDVHLQNSSTLSQPETITLPTTGLEKNAVRHKSSRLDKKRRKRKGDSPRRLNRADIVKEVIGTYADGHYLCPFEGCNKMYPSKKCLVAHMILHTDMYKCTWPNCAKGFRGKSALDDHYRMHLGEKRHKCEWCDYTSVQKGSLDVHVALKHLNKLKDRYQIKRAAIITEAKNLKIAARRNAIKQVKEKYRIRKQAKPSPKPPPLRFKKCWGPKPKLNEENKFPCDHPGCNHALKSWSSLMEHKTAVHGPKVFKCDFPGCNKAYAIKHYLVSHQVQHSTKHQCTWPGCNRKFRDMYNLRMHLGTHTGEKKLKCSLCDYSCIQRNSMNWHMKTKHPGEQDIKAPKNSLPSTKASKDSLPSTNPSKKSPTSTKAPKSSLPSTKPRKKRASKVPTPPSVDPLGMPSVSYQSAATEPNPQPGEPSTQPIVQPENPSNIAQNPENSYANFSTYNQYSYPPGTQNQAHVVYNMENPQAGMAYPVWPWYTELGGQHYYQQYQGAVLAAPNTQAPTHHLSNQPQYALPSAMVTDTTSLPPNDVSVTIATTDNVANPISVNQESPPAITATKDLNTPEASTDVCPTTPNPKTAFTLPAENQNEINWPPSEGGPTESERAAKALQAELHPIPNLVIPAPANTGPAKVQVLTDQGQVVAAELRYTCDQCTAGFQSARALNKHRKAVHVERNCVCPVENCAKKFKDNHSLKAHIARHEASIKCEWEGCSKTFHSMTNMRTHMRVHTGDKPYQCPHCNYRSTQRSAVKSHVVRKHLQQMIEDKPATVEPVVEPEPPKPVSINVTNNKGVFFVCDHPDCGKYLKSLSNLKSHKVLVHGPKVYHCEHPGCTKAYPTQQYLASHMRSHATEHPCPWPECKKTFRDQFNLKVHYKIHTGQKDLKCEICDYTCVQRNSMNHHLKRKHPEVYDRLQKEKKTGLCLLATTD